MRCVFNCRHMIITHTLIQKFLANQCTAAEAEMVARHLKKHPELMGLYMNSSWEAAEKENQLPPGYIDEMRTAILAGFAKRTRVIRFRWLAAACSLLIAGSALWLFSSVRNVPSPVLTRRKHKQQVPRDGGDKLILTQRP